MTLTGAMAVEGTQSDMAGGATADYTVTWADIAPTSFGWQVQGTTGNPSGPIKAQVFPFEQDLTVDFPLPDPVKPGRYNFTLNIAATEVNVNSPGQTLTAAAKQGFSADVGRDRIKPP